MCVKTKRLFLAQFLSLVKGDRIKIQCLKVRFTQYAYVALYVKYLYLTGALVEVRELLDRAVNVFSGEDFTVDESRGLNGVCNFLISASPEQVEIEVPVLLIVEAKRDNIKSGLGQCIAQMVAAQKLNIDESTNILTVYGSVTTGTAWRFLKLEGNIVTIELFDYPLPPVEKILSILLWMIQNSQQQPNTV